MTVVATRNASVDADLAQREAVIAAGLRSFLDVGRELTVIREQRLFYQDFETFEDYCLQRWEFSDSRARQMIGAVATVTNVTALGAPAPATESQARALTGLTPNDAAKVMTVVHEAPGKVTAEKIRIVREQVAPALSNVTSIGRVIPAPRAPFTQTAEEARIIGNEVWSRDLARCVWLLAGFGMHPDQNAAQLAGWVPTQDVYAEKTTPARLRQAATYLNDLADAWESRPHE